MTLGRLCAFLCLVGTLIAGTTALGQDGSQESIKDSGQATPISAQPIPHFQRDDPQRNVFGNLRYIGGMVLRSSNEHFGAISGLRISDQGKVTAIADTGFWFTGDLTRNEQGIPTGIQSGQMVPVLNERGEPFLEKWSADIEGLTFQGDSAFISTEMDMRVIRIDPKGDLTKSPSVRVTPPFKHPQVNLSFAFEAIATLPASHPLAPAQIVLTETNSDGGDAAVGFILKGSKMLQLSVRLHDGMFITDADFLPDGDLLILERRFTLVKGPLVRVRRIAGAKIRENAVLDGEVVLEAGPGQTVDNMEAMSVFSGPNGDIRIAIMSDNNHWLMQRTLYLEFALNQER